MVGCQSNVRCLAPAVPLSQSSQPIAGNKTRTRGYRGGRRETGNIPRSDFVSPLHFFYLHNITAAEMRKQIGIQQTISRQFCCFTKSSKSSNISVIFQSNGCIVLLCLLFLFISILNYSKRIRKMKHIETSAPYMRKTNNCGSNFSNGQP